MSTRSKRLPAPLGDVVRSLGWREVASNLELRDVVLDALGWPKQSSLIATATSKVVRSGEAEAKKIPLEKVPPLAPSVIPSDLQRLVQGAKLEESARPELGPLPLPSAAEHSPLFARPIDPLIEPRLARAVLGRVAEVRMRRGDIDIAAIVTAVAHGRPVTRLPRRPISTLAAGLQLLIDVSPAMAPFTDDFMALLGQLKQIVGTERIEVRTFEHCPSLGVHEDGTAELTMYMPPRCGIPVVAVSDLAGCGKTRLRPKSE